MVYSCGRDSCPAIERAHQAAVQDALTFIEKYALFTRTGPQGDQQVYQCRSTFGGQVGGADLSLRFGPDMPHLCVNA
jgi:hypothetical protein